MGLVCLAIILIVVSHETRSIADPLPQSGTLMATAEGNSAPSRVLKGHTSGVSELAWSPDGMLLASSAGGFQSTDFVVRLWRRDGSLGAELTGHHSPVSSLAWSPDGKILASGAYNEPVRLWRPDGSLITSLAVTRGTVFALDWSPDGSLIAAGIVVGPYDNIVQLWRPDGTLFKTLFTQNSGGKFYNLGWSPDGNWLVGGAIDYKEWRADGTTMFTSVDSGTPAWGFAWSPDSQLWAIGDESGEVWIYSFRGDLKARFRSNGDVNAMAWSPDSKILALGNGTLRRSDGTSIAALTGASSWITTMSWSPDGRLLSAGSGAENSRDYTMRLWRANGAALPGLTGHTGPVAVLAWSPDGKILASGSLDQTIRLWDMSACC